jgi:hypothetical protein
VRVLFDQGTPVPLRRVLGGHDVATAFDLGWSRLRNGDLIAAAEAAEFDVLVTTDQSLRYQQNLARRSLAIVVLRTTSWPRLQRSLASIVEAVDGAEKGSYHEVEITD